MSKSNKEKKRLALIRDIRQSNISPIPNEAFKIKINFINDELMDYYAFKQKIIDIKTKPLFKIRNNFDLIKKRVKPIIEKYKHNIAIFIATELNIFDMNINIWISEEGYSQKGAELYSLSFYLDTKKKSRKSNTYSPIYGKISFLTPYDLNNLAEYSQKFDNYIFDINEIELELDSLISNNVDRIFFSFSEYKNLIINTNNNNIDQFENKFSVFIKSLETEFNYNFYDDDFYFLSREYYIGNKSYWSIIPERKSSLGTYSTKIQMSKFREISKTEDRDFIHAMLESKILNVHSESVEDMSIKDIIDLSSLFGY